MTVIKQPVARWICTYFWIGVIASLVVFLRTKSQPSFIDLSFYPLILVEGAVIGWFLNHKLNSSLENLRMDHILPEDEFGVFISRVERRLNNLGANSVGIIVSLGVMGYYYLDSRRDGAGWSQGYLFVALIDIMLGYGLGVGAWKAMVLGWEFRNLGLHPKLQIRWSHPDKCAGLSATGEGVASSAPPRPAHSTEVLVPLVSDVRFRLEPVLHFGWRQGRGWKNARASGGTGGPPVAAGGSPEAFRAANPNGEARAEAAAARQMRPTRAASDNGRAARSTRSARVSAVARAGLCIPIPDSEVPDRL